MLPAVVDSKCTGQHKSTPHLFPYMIFYIPAKKTPLLEYPSNFRVPLSELFHVVWSTLLFTLETFQALIRTRTRDMGFRTGGSDSVLELPIYQNKRYGHQNPYQFSDRLFHSFPNFRNRPNCLSTRGTSESWVTCALSWLLTVMMLAISILSTFCLLRTALAAVVSVTRDPRDAPGGDVGFDYDVIIVGGGPAGLSALSGLARVRRKAILIDSGEYRNGDTRVGRELSLFLFLARGSHRDRGQTRDTI